MASNSPRPWTMEEEIIMVQSWIIVQDGVPVLPHLYLGNDWTRFFNTFNDTMRRSGRRRRSKQDINAKWADVREKVKAFNQVYQLVRATNEFQPYEVLVAMAKDQWSMANESNNFAHEDAWNLLKNKPYF